MRIVIRVILALGAIFLLLRPVIFSDSGSSDTQPSVVTIADYQGDFTVNAQGAMQATEVVTANFPPSVSRHGIFRYFDTWVRGYSNARLSIKVNSVTMDGGYVETDITNEGDGRYIVVRIGDPNKYVTPGQHVYRISYSVSGVMFPAKVGAGDFATTLGTAPTDPTSTFYWNVVGNGWRNAITSATARVTLPVAAPYVECGAGSATASQGPCQVAGVGTTTITATATNIPPMSGMTMRMPVVGPQPSVPTLPWPSKWDAVLGTSLPLAILLFLLTIVGGALGAFLEWRAREPKPGFPVMYAPPKDLGPAQVAYICEEEVPQDALLASIFRAADLKLVRLFKEDKRWTVQGITYPQYWDAADPATQSVGQSLGLTTYGAALVIDRKDKVVGEKLKSALTGATWATQAWAKDSQLVVSSTAEKLSKWALLACLVLGALGLWGAWTPTLVGLPFAAFAICGFGLLATGVGTRRTPAGRRVWSEAGGFRRMLSTKSSEQRFDFAARKDLFITYLPFAVAFGVAAAWADKYRTEMREEPPIPWWAPTGLYYGTGGWWGDDLVSGFNETMSSTISSYESSQSSSGGGGFDGGGFGGGGGGGGGGDW